MHRFASLIAGFMVMTISVDAGAADIDWAKVDQALGKPGSSQPGGVHPLAGAVIVTIANQPVLGHGIEFILIRQSQTRPQKLLAWRANTFVV